MTVPSAPYGVTVNVYLPLLSLSLGYAQVQGMWQQAGRIQAQPFKAVRPPSAIWQKLMAPLPSVWKVEKP